MAIWVNHGNTGTQDGTSRATGWDSINDALDNVGGDTEIRCADSGTHSVLSGTLAWVDGSTTINTSVDLTSSLATEDFIAKSDFQSVDGESIWEIASITSSVITLTHVYVGDTETISGNLKIATFDDPANELLDVDSITITGGWEVGDTTTPSGITFLRKTGTRTGDGITLTADLCPIENIGVLRYDRNFFVDGGYSSTGAHENKIENMYFIGAGDESVYLQSYPYLNIFKKIYSCCAGVEGVFEINASSNIYEDIYVYCNDRGTFRINGILKNIYYKRNNRAAVMEAGFTAKMINVTMSNNTIGFHLYRYQGGIVTVNNLVTSGNTNDFSIEAPFGREDPLCLIQNYNGAGNNQQIFANGIISRDTTDARSTQCVKFDPSSATINIQTALAEIPVDSGTGITVGIYMKDDSSFNGAVELSLWFMGAIIEDWTAKTMTTSYVQQTISCVNGDITEDGVVTLKCRVRGTAGNVFADDVSVV